VKLRSILLTILASIPLAAQDPPATILNIYREQIRPGKLAAFMRIEEAAARFCATARCPNPYFAITSLTGPDEAWWINGFDSPDAVEKVRQAYAANDQIAQYLGSVAEQKGDLVFPGITLLARLRDDLSAQASAAFGSTRYISIARVQVRPGQAAAFEKARQTFKFAVQRSGRAQWVYQVTSGSEDGTYLVMTPGRTTQEARAFTPSDLDDSILTSETRLYAVSPSLSMPAQSWQEADPDFWKRP
jgi:hypothetical protein